MRPYGIDEVYSYLINQGLFAGADDYEVRDNIIQGNLSTANGGGIAHLENGARLAAPSNRNLRLDHGREKAAGQCVTDVVRCGAYHNPRWNRKTKGSQDLFRFVFKEAHGRQGLGRFSLETRRLRC